MKERDPIERPSEPNHQEVAEEENKFAELRAVWVRPWADDVEADREAFERACQEVAPEDIVEAAITWVAAADAPRFLPPLAKWLTNRGWERDPPQKARKSAPRRSHARNGRKVDMAKLAFAIGGYVEDETGAMVWGGTQ
jgi:hypothetical protein